MIAAVVITLAGCETAEPPIEPSWQVDVMPLVAANCVRCHAYPFRGGGTRPDGTPRISSLRLDSFDDTELADGNVANGAAKSVQQIFRLTHDIALLPGQRVMPPDRPLDDYELAVIRNWAGLGNGEIAIRGPGHPDNSVPVVELVEVERDATSITFDYELRDADHDLVVGVLLGPRKQGDMVEPRAVVGNMTAGRDRFAWDITGVDPGDYMIAVRVDDGADVDPEGDEDFVEIELGLVTIP